MLLLAAGTFSAAGTISGVRLTNWAKLFAALSVCSAVLCGVRLRPHLRAQGWRAKGTSKLGQAVLKHMTHGPHTRTLALLFMDVLNLQQPRQEERDWGARDIQ